MTSPVHDVIKVLTSSLRKNFDDFKGVYLFGQFLDGKNHEDEDIEIVAIFDAEDKSKREEIWPIIGKIETEMNVCIDLYPYTMEEFKADEDLYKEVMDEGIFFNALGIMKD
ncbi:nucleotidyltransferase domain-containing protein [bacterium]|nr:nucleotidyltransferase domain-containing protein [bacterium]